MLPGHRAGDKSCRHGTPREMLVPGGGVEPPRAEAHESWSLARLGRLLTGAAAGPLLERGREVGHELGGVNLKARGDQARLGGLDPPDGHQNDRLPPFALPLREAPRPGAELRVVGKLENNLGAAWDAGGKRRMISNVAIPNAHDRGSRVRSSSEMREEIRKSTSCATSSAPCRSRRPRSA